MKKPAIPFAILLVGLLGAGLSGCPIYDDDDFGCYDSRDCADGYLCDYDSGACVRDDVSRCRRPSDCDVNETCGRFGSCSPGDCSFSSVGCVSGFECSRDAGIWECVPEASGAGGAGTGGVANGTGGTATGDGGTAAGGAPEPTLAGAGGS